MVNVFPQLEDARIEYEWSGKVAFTKDMLPYIGRLEDPGCIMHLVMGGMAQRCLRY